MARTRYKKIKKYLRERVRYAREFRESNRNRERYASLLGGIETFCLFIGYPRSGHSLVGALLDAHPEIVMAHELNVLKHVQHGFDREQLLYLIIENAASLAGRGRVTSGFNYSVPGQWQGRYSRLRVIGDKKGGGTTRLLMRSPDVLQAFKERIGMRVKAIHVVRNPFDNIATIARRVRHMKPVDPGTLAAAIDFFFDRVRTNHDVDEQDLVDVLTVRQEDLIADAPAALARMCGFLGVEPLPDYLEAAASIVFTEPNRTRFKIEWPADLAGRVRDEIARYPFLRGYSWES